MLSMKLSSLYYHLIFFNFKNYFSYALWLLDHSHESGRASAAMFFTYALQFRMILDRFDQHDGLRRLYNYVNIF